MAWQVKYGADSDFWHHVWKQTGEKPQPLQDLPELDFHQLRLTRAFSDLLDSQSDTYTLPFAEIESYCRMHRIADAATFAAHMRAMNRAYVEARADRDKPNG